jgi:HEPN domain-containing protein
MNDITKEWVHKAEQDFYSADILLHAGEIPIPDYACFHCQQCAEKYLKAHLQEHEIEFERSHELIPLLLLCVSQDSEFKSIKRELERLNRYAVIVRYPGITIEVETAEEALKQVGRVRTFVRKKLKIE